VHFDQLTGLFQTNVLSSGAQYNPPRLNPENAELVLVPRGCTARLVRVMDKNPSSLVFDQLVRPHFNRLYRLAYRLTGSKPEAEDLYQELLIKAFSKLDDLVNIEEPGSWLSRVMYNLFVDQHRRFVRQRMHIVEESQLSSDGIAGLPGDDDPVADNMRRQQLIRLDAALQQLSEEHRLVVLLHDTEGYKLKEIQELTGTPVGTVKSRLHRARARLREILVADGTFSRSRS
jgi:RNA polymerase sigma-70 factor, ECF subfamily